LVAQEIKRDKREDLFAATPPLEAKKLLFSIVASSGSSERFKIDFIDVRRAYFHAKSRRPVFVKLPPEDHQEGMCGRLMKAMYGTRDAAQNWELAYSEFVQRIGFISSLVNPCVFYHAHRRLYLVVHGDDFTIAGREIELDWFRARIAEEMDVKFRARLGPDEKDDKAVRILNRVVEWTQEGLIYEADQRHAELIVKDVGLKEGSKSVNTPGIKGKEEKAGESGFSESLFRSIAARGITSRKTGPTCSTR
jgi:hypothetical protein